MQFARSSQGLGWEDPLPLQPNNHQGLFGEAFVHVLARAAGLTIGKTDPDMTGDDWTLGYPGTRGTVRHPKIDIQVKSWSVPEGSPTHWRFRMRETHFNELAGADFSLPRFLFLVIVPGEAHKYAVADAHGLVLSHACYWVSLRDRQPVLTPRPGHTVKVDVPKRNLVTVTTLHSLFDPARENAEVS